MPALEILHLEHRIREIDFLSIVKQSPIVPPGREVFFAKGLYSGYDYDYVTALHLLVPQVENMVHYHLKNVGAKTTTLDDRGIETENGLSTLVGLPEMKAVFRDDLTFEIKALFCDPIGANFRNKLAHGLLEYNSCNSLHGVYTWWLILRLVLMCSGMLQDCPKTPKKRRKTERHDDQLPHYRKRPLKSRQAPFRVFRVFRGSSKTTDHTDHTESSRRRAYPFPCVQCIPWFQQNQTTRITQKTPAAALLPFRVFSGSKQDYRTHRHTESAAAALLSFRVFSVFRGSKW